jgi:hypothetical protein
MQQQLHNIRDILADNAKNPPPPESKYKSATEKKDAEEAYEKPLKEAVQLLTGIIDAMKNTVEANSLMDDILAKRGVYAVIAEATLLKEVIKHSSYSLFNLMAVTSGHNRYAFAREWVKAVRMHASNITPRCVDRLIFFLFFFPAQGNVPVFLEILRSCDVPVPNPQLVEYVFICVIVFAKHEEATFIKTASQNKDFVPLLFKLCLQLRLTYGLPGAVIWSALRLPEETFSHIIDIQGKISKQMASTGYFKEAASACRFAIVP